MKSWFLKKRKFENCIYITLSLFLIGVGLYFALTNKIIEGVTLLNPIVFGWPLIIISALLLMFEIYCLISKNSKLQSVKKVCYLLVIILSLVVIFDFIILGIVRTIIIVNGLSKKPTADYPLMVRLFYICKTKYKEILIGVGTTLYLSLAGTVIGLILGLLLLKFLNLQIISLILIQ